MKRMQASDFVALKTLKKLSTDVSHFLLQKWIPKILTNEKDRFGSSIPGALSRSFG